MSRRILLVVDSLFSLGDAYQLRSLAEGLSHEDEIAIGVVNYANQQEQDCNRFTTFDIPVHFLASGPKLKHRPRAAKIQTALRLRKRILAFGPDIVHAFGQTATLLAASILIPDDQTKLISSVLSKWKPQTTLTRWIEGCLVKRVDRFILAHDCLQNELQALDVSKEKLSLVPNAVADARAVGANDDRRQQGRQRLKETTGLDSSAFIALTFADLEPATRLKDLIWATDLLSCVRDDVHLVVLGKGSQHQRLLKFAACTEAADHIHFLGSPMDAETMLGGADVYWNSHLRSPLPSGLLAAMSCVVPVISVYGPETSPLIRHQETGFAVNFGARDEFARWTKFLIEKPEAAEQLASQGQQHVRRCFDARPMTSSIEKVYRDVENS